MKVNGYQIKEALRRAKMLRDIYSDQFPDSIWRFEGDDTEGPEEVMGKFLKADRALAELQAIQQWYNLQVEVVVSGEPMSLALAVKLVGGAGRKEKFWKTAATAKPETDRWSSAKKLTRTADEQHAELVISHADAASLASVASTEVGALRDAISRGNTTEIDLGDRVLPTIDG